LCLKIVRGNALSLIRPVAAGGGRIIVLRAVGKLRVSVPM